MWRRVEACPQVLTLFAAMYLVAVEHAELSRMFEEPLGVLDKFRFRSLADGYWR